MALNTARLSVLMYPSRQTGLIIFIAIKVM